MAGDAVSGQPHRVRNGFFETVKRVTDDRDSLVDPDKLQMRLDLRDLVPGLRRIHPCHGGGYPWFFIPATCSPHAAAAACCIRCRDLPGPKQLPGKYHGPHGHIFRQFGVSNIACGSRSTQAHMIPRVSFPSRQCHIPRKGGLEAQLATHTCHNHRQEKSADHAPREAARTPLQQHRVSGDRMTSAGARRSMTHAQLHK